MITAEFVFMGGGIGMGNRGASAGKKLLYLHRFASVAHGLPEFNILCDREPNHMSYRCIYL